MTNAISAAAIGEKKPRGVSGTAYPYFDLEASIKVAEAIHLKGGGLASPDQISAWLGYQTIRSGTYLTRIAAARQFGLIESAPDGFAISDRARTILAPVMPDDSARARIEAFLAVDLFNKIYESFKGKALPPESGLKNLFQQTYKILPDRTPPAVRVFLNSADQAGFFKTTGDRSRLVMPSVTGGSNRSADPPKNDEAPPAPAVHDRPKAPQQQVHDGAERVHSAIIGLLRDLPPPGTVWSPKKKKRFLDAFQASIDHIYPEEDDQ